MTDMLARARARQSFTTVLLLAAAAVALVVGILGVYAVIAAGVAERRVELVSGSPSAQARARSRA